MSNDRRSWTVLAGIVIVVAALTWIALAGKGRSGVQVAAPAPALPEDLKALLDDARALHKERQWCAAKDKWQVLQTRLEGQTGCDDLLQEAKSNRQTAQRHCSPGSEMIDKGETLEVPTSTDGDISEAEVLGQFPKGKLVRSIGFVDITGRGSNQSWGLRTHVHFLYTSQLAVETRVLENTGSLVEFEVGIPDVRQNLIVSEETVQLAPIGSPILEFVWKQFEDKVLAPSPGYYVVRRMADFANTIDPNLKVTLTSVSNWLKRRGIELATIPEAELRTRIDELAGHRLRLVYVPGIGVRTIKILEEDLLPRDDLLAFAQNSGLLTDYVVSRVLRTEVGQVFEVNVRDVVRMIGLNYDADVEGTLKLRREPDEQGVAVMSVVGGEIVVKSDVAGQRKQGTLAPIRGSVRFDKETLIVRWAQIDWRANIDWVSENHLLFGTQLVRDLEVQSHYEAERGK